MRGETKGIGIHVNNVPLHCLQNDFKNTVTLDEGSTTTYHSFKVEEYCSNQYATFIIIFILIPTFKVLWGLFKPEL